MLSILASGKLVRDPQTRTGRNGKSFVTGLLSVAVETRNDGEPGRTLVSAIAFGPAAEALGALAVGDDVSIAGAARLSIWIKDGEERHGLAVTAHRVLSAYQRRKTQRASSTDENTEAQPAAPSIAGGDFFDDPV